MKNYFIPEYCENCGEFIFDLGHECGGKINGSDKDKDYSERLEDGFSLSNMED